MADEIEKDLYNRLWENINNKETRVWTFLSFYGATIGIILGGTVYGGFLGIGLLFIIVFSFWTISFLISAEWWSARNRLMILAIEDAHKNLSEHVPSLYHSPKFTTENIIKISIRLIFCVSVFFMVFSINFFEGEFFCDRAASGREAEVCGAVSRSVPFLVPILQILFCTSILYLQNRREKRIVEFWDIVSDFRDRREDKTNKTNTRYQGFFIMSTGNLNDKRDKDMNSYQNYGYAGLIVAIWIVLISDSLYSDGQILVEINGVQWFISCMLALTWLALFLTSRYTSHGGTRIEIRPLFEPQLDRYGAVKAALFFEVLAFAFIST